MSSRILIHGLLKTILLYLDLNPLWRGDYFPNLQNVHSNVGSNNYKTAVSVYKWITVQNLHVTAFTTNCIDLNFTDVSSQLKYVQDWGTLKKRGSTADLQKHLHTLITSMGRIMYNFNPAKARTDHLTHSRSEGCPPSHPEVTLNTDPNPSLQL